MVNNYVRICTALFVPHMPGTFSVAAFRFAASAAAAAGAGATCVCLRVGDPTAPVCVFIHKFLEARTLAAGKF